MTPGLTAPRSRPVAGPLRPRARDGSYPFLNHRTVAEIRAAAGQHEREQHA